MVADPLTHRTKKRLLYLDFMIKFDTRPEQSPKESGYLKKSNRVLLNE